MERFSALQYDTKQSLTDKFNHLNSKLEFFQTELAKLWKFEDNLNTELERVREKGNSISELERINSGMNLIKSRNKLMDSTTSIQNKLNFKKKDSHYTSNDASASKPIINVDKDIQLLFNDSVIHLDKSKGHVEIVQNTPAMNKPRIHENKVRNSITIDLVDSGHLRVVQSGYGNEISDSKESNIPRVMSSKPVRASSRQSQDNNIKKINLSQDLDFDNPMAFSNPRLNNRIRSAHNSSVK
jgi:hypothetical protein